MGTQPSDPTVILENLLHLFKDKTPKNIAIKLISY